jgi:hypothetical protein
MHNGQVNVVRGGGNVVVTSTCCSGIFIKHNIFVVFDLFLIFKERYVYSPKNFDKNA